MRLLDRFLPRQEFTSYEDFKANYRVNIPDDFNFAYDVVDEWAKHDDKKPALIWVNDALEEKRYTFGDISRESMRAANALAARGIKKGDVVLLMLKQRPEVWLAMIALHRMGAVCIPATYQLTPKDIAYRCNAASARALICADDPEVIAHVEAAQAECPTVGFRYLVGKKRDGWLSFADETAAASDAYPRPAGENAVKLTDPMLMYFTSGTTGMPKMAWHNYSYPIGHITTAKYWNRAEDGGRHLTMSDSGWAKFGWGKIYGQWICGAVIVAYDTEKFDPKLTLEVVSRMKLTTFCAPPTVFRFIIKEDLRKYDLSGIKRVTTAGEPLNPEVFEQFKAATGLSINEGFGQSETSVLLGNYEWFPPRPGSMGKPSPLYDVDILDENGKPCEDGIPGAVVIKNADEHPAGMFQGYYLDADATARSWSDGVYSTGDLAWRDGDGYYWFVGRDDDLIKCSGYRIGPFEVESALVQHKSVLECAVTAAPDPLRGQVVKATIVLAPGYSPSDALKKELQDHVKRVTAPYKYPRIVEFVGELPKTFSGKIRRMEIRRGDSAK